MAPLRFPHIVIRTLLVVAFLLGPLSIGSGLAATAFGMQTLGSQTAQCHEDAEEPVHYCGAHCVLMAVCSTNGIAAEPTDHGVRAHTGACAQLSAVADSLLSGFRVPPPARPPQP